MFEPVQGKWRCAGDPDTGIEMSLQGASDYGLRVTVRLPDGREFVFSIGRDPKIPDRPFTGLDPSNPTIEILMGTLEMAAVFWNGSVEENTKFVRLILSGLSAINRTWPLSRNPFFYGDRWRYQGREDIFHFDLPSDEEIARL
jgi:hypothetical protein